MADQSYTVNGVPLENDTFGWYVLRASQILTPVAKGLSNVDIPGRHGVIQGIPAYKDPPTVTLVVRTPLTSLEYLYALFEKNGGNGYLQVTSDSTRQIPFELASLQPEGIGPKDEIVNLSVTLRHPTAAWRAVAATTLGPVTPANPIVTYTVFNGQTADVSDAKIFISGDFQNFNLRDIGTSSWVKTVKTFPYQANTGLLYLGATGQAYRANTSAPWTPVTDMSDYVDQAGGGGFRITPNWTTDPSVTSGQVELTTTNQSGVSFQVQGNNAYSLRNAQAL